MKFTQLPTLLALSLAFTTSFAFAQKEGSGHSGGGSVTESDLRYYMGKIDTYLLSDEGKRTFPEVNAYDQAHLEESFHQLIQNTRPVVQKGELRDENGNVRDCMSYANPGNRYFVCNSDALPEKTLENQPSFYRIVLHELFVQAGIEKPISKAIPSDYKVSYRITENVHLETYQEWVPGKKSTSPARSLKQTMKCQAILRDSNRAQVSFLLEKSPAHFKTKIENYEFTVSTIESVNSSLFRNVILSIRELASERDPIVLNSSDVIASFVDFKGMKTDKQTGQFIYDSPDVAELSLSAWKNGKRTTLQILCFEKEPDPRVWFSNR